MFDVRGLMPRPLYIAVETATLTGELVTGCYHHGLVRLVLRQVDHRAGELYAARMRPCINPLPVEEYKLTGELGIRVGPTTGTAELWWPRSIAGYRLSVSTCSAL